ncbi:MAG TPA: ABC transporter permease [Solirubrobacteraceae bacterium]|jgi:ABC-type dipeptide/oligopeptide/nickel transport system permease subunit|nr:ABC transporter permease [Solirubrobacteraceae bacterium]
MSAKRPPFLVLGGSVTGAFVLIAAFAPLVAPYGSQTIAGPALASPSMHHLLGTNDVGQDILSQLIWGARTAALVALPAAAIAMLVGLLVGGLAGLLGGWVDSLTMRIVDMFLAIPMLPLLILIAALVGPSQITVIVLIAAGAWPSIARVLRSQTLSLAQRGHVRAARGFGGGALYVLRRHLAPALGPMLTANLVYWMGTAVVLQSGLAFLGLSDPTQVSWGEILNRALTHEGVYFSSEWVWWVLPAGFAIIIVCSGLAFLGLAFEPRFNPRWNRA